MRGEWREDFPQNLCPLDFGFLPLELPEKRFLLF